MKKGCFLTVIIFLTIVLIVVFYLVKFYGEDLLDVGKEKLVEFAQEKIYNDITDLQENEYVDSLKFVVNNYFNDLENLDVGSELEKIEEFTDNFEVILMDSKIDSTEFDFIKNFLVKHGKREEN